MKQGYARGGNFTLVVIIIIAALPLWLPVMVLTVDKYYFTPARNIETVWNVDIPSDFNQIYHTSSDSIFARGDGYTVYEAPEEMPSFINGFLYKNQASIEDYVKEIIVRLSVQQDYRPLFEEPYYYTNKSSGGDILVIVYSPASKYCFFVESFSWDE